MMRRHVKPAAAASAAAAVAAPNNALWPGAESPGDGALNVGVVRMRARARHFGELGSDMHAAI
jgi:hypothetical protein